MLQTNVFRMFHTLHTRCCAASRIHHTTPLLPPPTLHQLILPFHASHLQFDKKVTGEPERPKDKRRLVRLPNEMGSQSEHARHSEILRRVLGGSGEGEKAGSAGVPSSMTKQTPKAAGRSASRSASRGPPKGAPKGGSGGPSRGGSKGGAGASRGASPAAGHKRKRGGS